MNIPIPSFALSFLQPPLNNNNILSGVKPNDIFGQNLGINNQELNNTPFNNPFEVKEEKTFDINWKNVLGSNIVKAIGNTIAQNNPNSIANATNRFNAEQLPNLQPTPNNSRQALYGMSKGGFIKSNDYFEDPEQELLNWLMYGSEDAPVTEETKQVIAPTKNESIPEQELEDDNIVLDRTEKEIKPKEYKNFIPIEDVHENLQTFFNDMNETFPGLKVTSTTGGKHKTGSRHYSGRAIDIGANSSDKTAYSAFKQFVRKNPGLKEVYGIEDIIDENDHFHIELPKKQKGGSIEPIPINRSSLIELKNRPQSVESTAVKLYDPVNKKITTTANPGVSNINLKSNSDAIRSNTKIETKEKTKKIAERKAAVNAKDNNAPFTFPTGEVKKWEDMNFREKSYVSGKALGQRFRFNEDDDSFVDNWLNPFNMIGTMGDNLASSPYEAKQSNSNLPYVSAIGVPLVMGRAIGSGSINPFGQKFWTNEVSNSQVLNNMALGIPGAVEKSMESGLLSNTHKLNPFAFKPNPEAYYHRSPNLENIINKETGMLQGFGQSEAGRLFDETAGPRPGMGINLKKAANSKLYFAKGTPLDWGRTNMVLDEKTGKLIPGQGYPGPYMVEVKGVPMGASTKGRAPGAEPTRIGSYAVPKRPISLDEAIFYKEDWLRGYKKVPKPTVTPKTNIYSSEIIPTKQINWWEEPGFKERNPNFNPEKYINNVNKFGSPKSELPEYMKTKNINEMTKEEYKKYQSAIRKYRSDYWKEKQKKGGIIKDNNGQWSHPGEVT